MKNLIWYSPRLGRYNYGTEMDYNINRSLTGEDLTVLYELDDSELRVIKKIVDQLNTAREQNTHKDIALYR